MAKTINIVKTTTGEVLIQDFISKFVYKELAENAALFLSNEDREGGIWVVDEDGQEYHIPTKVVLRTEIQPNPSVVFVGGSRTLYELLETSFFYNLVNPPGGGGGGLTTAGNGLSVTGGIKVILGGTLDQNTNIDGVNTYGLTLSNLTYANISGGQIRDVLSQGVNYTILNTDYAVECTANITLTLPASPTIGQAYEIFANNNTITINANVGQTVIGKSSVSIKKYSAIKVRYTSANNWLII